MDGENAEAAANAEMPPTDAAALNDGLDDSDEDDAEKIPEEVYQANLLNACRENNTEAVKEALVNV
jgi:hypothetical protein|tara:strand:- start:333 stop:530 length:198 start_codon:yes stop_codon:yes gene_type:complete